MIEFNYEIRVRYSEVDQMGFLYHGNYVNYLDIARTEMIRDLGTSNFDIEQEGIMIPVLNVSIAYGKPAHYDDILRIRTMIKDTVGVKATFHYEIYRQDELLTTAQVVVGFMKSTTKRACRPPRKLYEIVINLLNNSKKND